MERSRIFVAVDVAAAVRSRAAGLQARLAQATANVRWVEPNHLHLTLVFLGETDNRDLPAVCRAVREVAGREPPFTVQVAGLGAFPNVRRPKVVWAGVTKGAEALRRLFARLEERLYALGCYRREERAYTPHLTLGRVRGEADGLALAPALARHAAWEGGSFPVGEVVVYASELTRDGPVYTVVGRAELGG